MQHFFVSPDAVKEDKILITGSDVNHIRNVLRLRPGDEIAVSDGRLITYTCVIEKVSESEVVGKIRDVCASESELAAAITLFQALPKGDKMDTVVQKAVELGACEVVPVMSSRCVVRLDEKKAAAKCERWNKIALGAAKQSGRGIVPKVADVTGFRDAITRVSEFDRCLLFYEQARDMDRTREVVAGIGKSDRIAVFIGPEGGWSDEEVSLAEEAGAFVLTLGRRILRTETAGAAVLSVLSFFLEE